MLSNNEYLRPHAPRCATCACSFVKRRAGLIVGPTKGDREFDGELQSVGEEVLLSTSTQHRHALTTKIVDHSL